MGLGGCRRVNFQAVLVRIEISLFLEDYKSQFVAIYVSSELGSRSLLHNQERKKRGRRESKQSVFLYRPP